MNDILYAHQLQSPLQRFFFSNPENIISFKGDNSLTYCKFRWFVQTQYIFIVKLTPNKLIEFRIWGWKQKFQINKRVAYQELLTSTFEGGAFDGCFSWKDERLVIFRIVCTCRSGIKHYVVSQLLYPKLPNQRLLRYSGHKITFIRPWGLFTWWSSSLHCYT